MSKLDIDILIMAFVMGVHLLRDFHTGICLPEWLAPLNMAGIVSVLLLLVPMAQKGSLLAFLAGYVLMGVLIVNFLVLLVFALIPGNPIIADSPATAQTGKILIRLLQKGSMVLMQKLFAGLAQPTKAKSEVGAQCA
jgi:hypothetical protein